MKVKENKLNVDEHELTFLLINPQLVSIGKSFVSRLVSIEIFASVDHPEFSRHGLSKIDFRVYHNCLGEASTNQRPTLGTNG